MIPPCPNCGRTPEVPLTLGPCSECGWRTGFMSPSEVRAQEAKGRPQPLHLRRWFVVGQFAAGAVAVMVAVPVALVAVALLVIPVAPAVFFLIARKRSLGPGAVPE